LVGQGIKPTTKEPLNQKFPYIFVSMLHVRP
jgi:hypothetical protein